MVIITPTSTPSPAPISTPTPTPQPPLVTLGPLQVETIKVGAGKKAKKETVLVLQFSGALNSSAANNVGGYESAPVIKANATGKGKNRKPATTRLGAPVAMASAGYSPSNNSVTLTPRVKLTATKPEELIVNGSLLTDTLGREIDGNSDGPAGGEYFATISGNRVTAGGLPLARTSRRPAGAADFIDHVLARGDLMGLNAKHQRGVERE